MMKTYNIQIDEAQRETITTALLLMNSSEASISPEEYGELVGMFCDLRNCNDPHLCNGFCF